MALRLRSTRAPLRHVLQRGLLQPPGVVAAVVAVRLARAPAVQMRTSRLSEDEALWRQFVLMSAAP
eukprot:9487819-Pyramimonas_sp.AAC.1